MGTSYNLPKTPEDFLCNMEEMDIHDGGTFFASLTNHTWTKCLFSQTRIVNTADSLAAGCALVKSFQQLEMTKDCGCFNGRSLQGSHTYALYIGKVSLCQCWRVSVVENHEMTLSADTDLHSDCTYINSSWADHCSVSCKGKLNSCEYC